MGKTSQALLEHYGFSLSTSAIDKITQKAATQAKAFNSTVETEETPSPLLIVELDGSMVPIVQYSAPSEELKKKGLKHKRDCHWREFRLCTVSRPGETSTTYGVVQGDPFQAGCMMSESCRKKSLNESTQIHGVADGAPWIAEQYETQFGSNHEFHLDYYHATEYLALAADEIRADARDGQSPQPWLSQAKEKLKQGHAAEVIVELSNHATAHPEKNGIKTAHQYLSKRESQLNYPRALARDLPIGSGEVESAHRSILQSRLKQPGAWWTLENAENMVHLKVMQANEHWNQFWQKAAA